ncbi:jumonji domain containing 5 [Coprinopsis cinerea okayama7|uniref:Jumonji domain containing 5 n=1 Tax=Coprinopsis cinerea (strain Okayama-7 / 130 / ATCC MYA-4618 / FGSC 9003) TaxID=240176 RepID=D6RKN5_COPC7|nr:jumonji domain containing 5 [Coprinopsis cinerea okayama7\|eukprot:XP_002911887.1 jumonji domain containing 5 [Coprinopsis cinerea okayama7\
MLDFEDQPAQLPSDEKHYLAQHNLFIQFPDLRDDILVPDYAYATGFYKHLPDYKPPNNEEGIIFNHWLGPENTISPAHIDPYNNLYGLPV